MASIAGSTATIQVRTHSNPRGGEYSVIVSRTYEEMSERAALLIASRLITTPNAVVGVTVGATPVGTYQALANLAARSVADVSSAHFLVVDEFFPADSQNRRSADEASLRRRAKDDLTISPHLKELQSTLFQPLKVPEEHIHHPNSYLSPAQAAATYSEVAQLRRMDLALLHCGTRGNIGWLTDPREADEWAGTRDMQSYTAQENHGFQACVTLGLAPLMQAKELIVFAVGKNKAEIVKKVLEDTKGNTVLSWLLQNHPRVLLFLDTPAASFIPELNAGLQMPLSIRGFDILNDPKTITNKRVICISPHPDDTSISAGATLAFLSANNSVTSVVATTGHRAYIPNTTPEERIQIREDEAREEARLLGAQVKYLRLPLYNRGSAVGEDDVEIMHEYFSKFKPHVIFLPHTGDAHPTHRAVVRTVLLAVQKILHDKDSEEDVFARELYMYEGPWSLFAKGSYNVVCSPPPDHFAQKIAAIRAHKSQTGRTPYDRAGDALALLRGSLVPEQDLAGFGEEPPRLEERVELFFRKTIKTPEDVALLLRWVENQQPPSVVASTAGTSTASSLSGSTLAVPN